MNLKDKFRQVVVLQERREVLAPQAYTDLTRRPEEMETEEQDTGTKRNREKY